MNQINKLTIIGAGFIGGSIAIAVKKNKIAKQIAIFARSRTSFPKAQEVRLEKNIILDLKESIKDSNLIILCSPVDDMEKLTKAIISENTFSEDCILTDVGSTKENIVNKLDNITKNTKIKFIGSHPIAGSEKSGINHSNHIIFKNAPCVVTPSVHTHENSTEIIAKFWEELGMNVKIINPEKHDIILSKTSHLPHAVASALIKTSLSPTDNNYRLSKELSGTGLKDSTRISAANPEMWTNIFFNNSKNNIKSIDEIISKLEFIKKSLENNEKSKLEKFLIDSQILRNSI